jgi:hypothetical protein
MTKKQGITGAILAIWLLLGAHAYAQGETYRRTEEYCKVWTFNEIGRSGVEARIDYGQERRSVADIQIRDESGRPVRFHSAMDVLNYLNGEGWELVSAVYDQDHENMFYIMRRKR